MLRLPRGEFVKTAPPATRSPCLLCEHSLGHLLPRVHFHGRRHLHGLRGPGLSSHGEREITTHAGSEGPCVAAQAGPGGLEQELTQLSCPSWEMRAPCGICPQVGKRRPVARIFRKTLGGPVDRAPRTMGCAGMRPCRQTRHRGQGCRCGGHGPILGVSGCARN